MHLLKPNYTATIKTRQFCLWNHLEPNMSVTFLVRNICPGEMQGHPTSRGALRVRQEPTFPPVTPRRRWGHPPICSMRFLQESEGMGWIICRASVSVVGLSRAGHSSGVASFPRVEDDSLPERRGRSRLFLSNDTPRPARERRPHRRPWPDGP